MSKSIPFNKAPFFQNEFTSAMKKAAASRHFKGDGTNTEDCIQFFKSRYGYERSLLTPSCTASLEMTALMLDLGPGDEVIVPTFTFVTSASAFSLRGVKIVFADSERDSPNVCVSDLLKKITKRTKAIVVVHYAGVPVDVSRIIKETGGTIPIVEDCAHAIGSIDPRTGDYIGKLGCASTFSFHETKNVGIGEGGLLVVNDEKLWLKAQIIREKGTNRTEFWKGNVPFYSWVGLGSSYLMSDIDAAMLWSALQNVDRIQSRRLAIWDAYDSQLVRNSLFHIPNREFRANAHMYFLKFRKTEMREKFISAMKDLGIVVSKHYLPLHKSVFAQKNYDNGVLCPVADEWAQTIVRLPLFYDLSDENLVKVITAINSFTAENGFLWGDATEEHWGDILNIRNENSTYFQNTQAIKREDHWNFMRKYHKCYHIVTEGGKCVGFIGQVKKDFRMGTFRKGSGVSAFMIDMWIHTYGRKYGLQMLRKNMRGFAFARKMGYAPEKNSWEAGEDPVKLIQMSQGEYVDIMNPEMRARL